MAHRSTKEKAEAQKVARKLYVEDGLSLKEIHQQTGETMRTLRSWCTIGDWENLREKEAKTELDRLKDLRSNLLDRAEAQMKEDKLPHIEIGLMYKLERMIDRREQEQGLPETVALLALRQFGPQLARLGGEPSNTYRGILTEFGKSISEQGFPRLKQAASPPKQAASPPKQAASPPKQAASPPKQAASPPKQAASPPKQAASPPSKPLLPSKATLLPSKASRLEASRLPSEASASPS